MERVVEISENSAASIAEGHVPKDLHRNAAYLLRTGGTNETGQHDDVGDVALAGGANLHGQGMAVGRGDNREARAIQTAEASRLGPGGEVGASPAQATQRGEPVGILTTGSCS